MSRLGEYTRLWSTGQLSDSFDDLLNAAELDYVEIYRDFEDQKISGYYDGLRLIGMQKWRKLLQDGLELPDCGETLIYEKMEAVQEAIIAIEDAKKQAVLEYDKKNDIFRQRRWGDNRRKS